MNGWTSLGFEEGMDVPATMANEWKNGIGGGLGKGRIVSTLPITIIIIIIIIIIICFRSIQCPQKPCALFD
jgi:hypothetical protein